MSTSDIDVSEPVRSDDEEKRGRGRPRNPGADAAILDATLVLLAEQGPAALSIEAVAARAGVGRATVYRRWPSRDDLVAAAFAAISDNVVMPDTGSVRDDLIDLLQQYQHLTLRTLPATLVPRLIALCVTSGELLQVFIEKAFAPRREAVLGVLRRGQARGELRADVDIELAFMMLSGPAFYMALIDAVPAIADSDLPRRVVETLLRGLHALPLEA